MRQLLSSWQDRINQNSNSSQSPHLLDLRQQRGFLKQQVFDLQSDRPSEVTHYLRRHERWQLPASYRTGLAFFATVLLVSVMGISAFDARGMAESRQAAFGAQILQEFDQLALELDQYAPGNDLSDRSESLADQHEAVFATLQTSTALMEPGLSGSAPLSGYEHPSQVAELGLEMSKGFRHFETALQSWNDMGQDDQRASLEQIERLQDGVKKAQSAWEVALAKSEQLPDEALGSLEAGQLAAMLEQIQEFTALLEGLEQGAEVLPILLGHEEPQRIVVMLQNPDQSRAGGGALSAGVEMLVEDGEILSWNAFHAEDYDQQLKAQLQPPVGLDSVTNHWNLRTANAFMDGQQSAEQLHWFWQREARSSLDLVVLINTSALERLFDDQSLVTALAPDRASDLQEISLRWSAHQLSNDHAALKGQADFLIGQLMGLLKRPDLVLRALPRLIDLAQEKQILVNSFQPELQTLLVDLGLTGRLPVLAEQEDFLMVSSINTAINGSDRWIEPRHELHTAIDEQGRIKHWLKIDVTHRWHDNMIQSLRDRIGFPVIQDVLRRLSYDQHSSLMRVVVPRGSNLTGAGSLTIDQISTLSTDQFTIWSFPVEVKAGKTSSFELFYELPWSFDTETVDNYRLHLVKQPGKISPLFSHHLKLPAGLSLFQQLPDGPIGRIDRDQVIAVVAGKSPVE